ncbi:hypothetical protein PCC7424_4537 [Gloeothece citriformis PCC 7424]|uniref:Uncharacterized protein n=1 Tax=Gloeothece citriformis (strain PCC 7424) TaxID=65393 RepID=B7KAC6_GLOC7|nr:hypothetical protein [Gloeothece citriformis]ACK72900.1 hypothetical protein PCC7424_4537 [Gloeothece citriformis PCC 7424]
MAFFNRLLNQKTAGIMGLFGAVAVGIPMTGSVASAQEIVPSSACPSIYYEEPWEDFVEVPLGCPLNDSGLYEEYDEYREVADEYNLRYPLTYPHSTPPAPYNNEGYNSNQNYYSDPVGYIYPEEGSVDIRLVNSTGEPVTYDVAGRTGVGIISKDGDIVLENVSLPATISVVGEDNEYLRMIPISSQTDYLQINLEDGDEDTWGATNIDGILEIQDDGRIWMR